MVSVTVPAAGTGFGFLMASVTLPVGLSDQRLARAEGMTRTPEAGHDDRATQRAQSAQGPVCG